MSLLCKEICLLTDMWREKPADTWQETDIPHHSTCHTYLFLLWHTVFFVLILTGVIPEVYPCLHREGRSLTSTGSIPDWGDGICWKVQYFKYFRSWLDHRDTTDLLIFWRNWHLCFSYTPTTSLLCVSNDISSKTILPLSCPHPPPIPPCPHPPLSHMYTGESVITTQSDIVCISPWEWRI
jgi:hypothetical protein